MPSEEIRLGPFVAGLDTYSDPTAISDTALASVINFEMDGDTGSLVNRPPISTFNAGVPGATTGNGGTKLLGYFSAPGNVFRLIASNRKDATYWFDGSTWTKIADINATAIVQYRDDLWLITGPNDPLNGGKWNPGSGFTTDVNIPHGAAIIAHKDRLWVIPGKAAMTGGTRLYMSVIVSAAVSWPVSKVIIDIGAGDGQNIVDVVMYINDLVIFKERSTYRFSYSSDPATGSVSRISATIGAMDTGCFAEYENQLYVLHNNKVFLFANYNYSQVNSNVPLRASDPSAVLHENASLSIWAERIFVEYYDATFVFSIKTQTWTMWDCADPSRKFLGRFLPFPGALPDMPTAYVTSVSRNTGTIYRVIDAITDATEDMTCTIETKNYDYQSASKFKRLFWWGVDVIANVSLRVEARPVVFARTVTWGEARAYTWGQLKTWGRLLDTDINVWEVIPVEGSAYGRKYVKATPVSLRFRQISFKVSGETKGDTTTAPLRIFNLTTFVKDKQQVSKKIS